MYAIEDIKTRLGLDTLRQVRRRLDSALPLIDRYIRRGNKNQILLEESGVLILEQILQFEKQGLQIEEAVNQVSQELASDQGKTESEQGQSTLTVTESPEVELLQSENSLLRERVEDLREMIDYLKEQNKQLVLALPSPPAPHSNPSVVNGNGSAQKPSRWRALMYVIWGK